MNELPKTYLGAKIGHGYLLALDPGESESEMYLRMLTAAQMGDVTAQAILRSVPYNHVLEYEPLRQASGVIMYLASNRVTLSDGHWPPSIRGTCMEHLIELAQDGNFMASRAVAYIARQRLTNPDFVLKDHG